MKAALIEVIVNSSDLVEFSTDKITAKAFFFLSKYCKSFQESDFKGKKRFTYRINKQPLLEKRKCPSGSVASRL